MVQLTSPNTKVEETIESSLFADTTWDSYHHPKIPVLHITYVNGSLDEIFKNIEKK
jgi:hypothetical protein